MPRITVLQGGLVLSALLAVSPLATAGNIESGFSPGVTATRLILKAIASADASIDVAAYSSVTYLANHGVSVRKNGRYAIMHNKFMVLDGKSVETGSYNYTSSAEKCNAENAVLISDVPHTAAAYTHEFNRLWSEADTVSPSW